MKGSTVGLGYATLIPGRRIKDGEVAGEVGRGGGHGGHSKGKPEGHLDPWKMKGYPTKGKKSGAHALHESKVDRA